jgi:hypothetical protein
MGRVPLWLQVITGPPSMVAVETVSTVEVTVDGASVMIAIMSTAVSVSTSIGITSTEIGVTINKLRLFPPKGREP